MIIADDIAGIPVDCQSLGFHHNLQKLCLGIKFFLPQITSEKLPAPLCKLLVLHSGHPGNPKLLVPVLASLDRPDISSAAWIKLFDDYLPSIFRERPLINHTGRSLIRQQLIHTDPDFFPLLPCCPFFRKAKIRAMDLLPDLVRIHCIKQIFSRLHGNPFLSVAHNSSFSPSFSLFCDSSAGRAVTFCYSSARSVHSLHRPYENAEPAGIRPIAKRFSMAGCRNSSVG